MNKSSICAGIVTFNPDIELLKKNIDSIIRQVDSLFIFDNGSNNSEIILKLSDRYSNVNIIFGEKNYGIAYAHNRINERAVSEGYKWILSLDQDSICCSNLINTYMKFIEFENVAMICPFILNNSKYTLEEYNKLTLPEYTLISNPNDCITSACLSSLRIIEEIGGYCEKLFIDYVDTELNCRVIQKGFKIIRANNAYLIQKMGEGKRIKLFSSLYKITRCDIFRKMKVVSVYSDLRLYYQARNSKYVYDKYNNAGRKLSPLYMFLLFTYFSLFYPNSRDRKKMWKSICEGRKDGKRMLKDDIDNTSNV